MILNQDAFKRIIENLHDGLYIIDENGRISFWNKAAERITGFPGEEVIGTSCSDSIFTHLDAHGNDLNAAVCPIGQPISNESPREAEVYASHKTGRRVPVSVRISVLTDARENAVGYIGLFSDISGKKASELRIRELEKMALLDKLTQLANRYYIEREIRNRFEEKKRFNIPFGILFMDIDHFKTVNDTYGHDVGDKVLMTVADVLVRNVRPFDLFGRWGGEEFVGIIRNIRPADLEHLGNRLRMLIADACLPHGREKLRVTVSIGATLVDDDDTMESVFKRADRLLYQSKAAGRNRLTIA
ncbi:diguanylate cyclase [Desulfococcus sp.]|uniref:sensor domain-containing diguanylate cyclase n=1 Tax=Desulfococcus sp. TaxID=2025834 RepID=UPI0035933EE3